MKKRILTLLMAVAVCITAVPATVANASKTTTTTIIDEEDSQNSGGGSSVAYDDDDDDPSGDFVKEDLAVYPAKKTIKIGQSFFIDIVASNESEWADLEDPEWEEICEENIDSISFRSTKTSVASVNKVTGKVVGKKKGNAVIKTTINLVNGQSATFKTKVYVTK